MPVEAQKERPFICPTCGTRFAEYINGCPHCENAGLRSGVTEPPTVPWENKCPRCDGTGIYNFGPCSICKGTGKLSEIEGCEDSPAIPESAPKERSDSNCNVKWWAGRSHLGEREDMSNPQTLEEANKYLYGSWSGHPRGNRFDAKRCAYEVYPTTGGWIPYQCLRKPNHGPAKLYCKQHAKKVAR